MPVSYTHLMVRLKSGDMITIGGLIDKEESRTFRKVPILGDIPIPVSYTHLDVYKRQEQEEAVEAKRA